MNVLIVKNYQQILDILDITRKTNEKKTYVK